MNCPVCPENVEMVAAGINPINDEVIYRCPKCDLSGTARRIRATRPAMTAEVAKMARIANPSTAKFDPDFTIPKEVMDAERIIADFWEKQGSESWELGRTCSRNHAEKLRRITATIIE